MLNQFCFLDPYTICISDLIFSSNERHNWGKTSSRFAASPPAPAHKFESALHSTEKSADLTNHNFVSPAPEAKTYLFASDRINSHSSESQSVLFVFVLPSDGLESLLSTDVRGSVPNSAEGSPLQVGPVAESKCRQTMADTRSNMSGRSDLEHMLQPARLLRLLIILFMCLGICPHRHTRKTLTCRPFLFTIFGVVLTHRRMSVEHTFVLSGSKSVEITAAF
ncbi:unnamed protein product [Protopolystoma xenopodis]|uniref:Uncharacterized protein n=1 Tax=Protopolystoma xenopodis TaxID=117903 RepID=A0A3S5AWS0_9PLAT|nr:unnamed protein product [Protopolystoma xenopodis]